MGILNLNVDGELLTRRSRGRENTADGGGRKNEDSGELHFVGNSLVDVVGSCG